MSPVAELVIKGIEDAFLYLPMGYIWAAGIVFVLMISGLILKFGLHKRVNKLFWWRLLPLFFLIAYIYCVLQLTVLSRETGSFGGIDWRFLAKWNESNEQKAFLIENIIMFIPFGVLLPMLGKWLNHILISWPIAIVCSVGLETAQLKYQLGHCQLDDVVANSTGFLVGFLVYLMIADICFFLHSAATGVLFVKKKITNRLFHSRNTVSKIDVSGEEE